MIQHETKPIARQLLLGALLLGLLPTACNQIPESPSSPPPPSASLQKQLPVAPQPLFRDDLQESAYPREASFRSTVESRSSPTTTPSPRPDVERGTLAPATTHTRAARAEQTSREGDSAVGGMNSRPPSRLTADDAMERLFERYSQKFKDLASRSETDEYAAMERRDLESKLIALFFLRDRKRLEDYKELIRSFREKDPVSVELELLKAALYQKVGLTDLRDRSLARIQNSMIPLSGDLRVQGLSFAQEIRGYRSFTPLPAAEFSGGQTVLLYGEIEGFRNTPVSRGGARTLHRRSFQADLILRDETGKELDRRELLRAGSAVDFAEDASKPVHFWGRYPIPAHLTPGSYRLEVEARDLEGNTGARSSLPLRIR